MRWCIKRDVWLHVMWAVMLGAACVALAGCMERRERWVVQPDGSVRAWLEYRADSEAELYDGDAAPNLIRGWIIEEVIEPTRDGQEQVVLYGQQTFAADDPLPDHYADRDPGDPDIFLHFPTSAVIEHRRDGTYYHFTRTYRSRPWAYVTSPIETVRREYEDIMRADFHSLTRAEQARFIEILAQLETVRYEAIARQAYMEISRDVPQDAWLAIRSTMHAVARDRDYEAMAAMLGSEDTPPDHHGLSFEAERFEREVLQAMKDALQGSPFLGPAKFNEFSRRFHWHSMYYEVTRDLQDEQFDIRVHMPGRIIGHNGREEANGVVRWQFSGAQLFDRDHELMVTSVVP